MSEELLHADRVRNPFIVALWVLGVVTLALGFLGIFASQQYLGATGYGYSGEPPLPFLLAQLGSFLSPSIATGGFVFVALALAVSALHRYGAAIQIRAQRAETVPSPDTAGAGGADSLDGRAGGLETVAPSRDAASVHVSAFAPRPSGRTSPDFRPPTTDHERFMRPAQRN